MSKLLPLKKRLHTVHQGDREYDSNSSSNSPQQSNSQSPADPSLLDDDSPNSVHPNYSEAGPSDTSYPMMSPPHTAAEVALPEPLSMSTSSQFPSEATSPEPSTSSMGASGIKTKIPDHLANFFPDAILPLIDDQPETGTKTKKKKKASFVYYIKGQPINSSARRPSVPSSRSRHNSDAESNMNPAMSSLTDSFPLTHYAGIPHAPKPQQPSDYYSSQPTYDHPMLHGGIIQPTPILAATAAPFGSLDASTSRGFVNNSPLMLDDYNPVHVNSPDASKKKKIQQCRYCANHDLYMVKKGHKYNCNFSNCDCEQCVITRNRQIAVRRQAQQTRRQEALRIQQQHFGGDPSQQPSTSAGLPDEYLDPTRSYNE